MKKKGTESKNEVRETEEQQGAARGAAQSGDLELILALSPTEFEFAMAAILRMLGMSNIQRVGGSGHLGVDILAGDAFGPHHICPVQETCEDQEDWFSGD